MKSYKTIMVHGGKFHADDIMCVALMKTLTPNIKVERVFRVPDHVADDVIICDIGWGRYDHHQPDCKLREDGYKHAACGLVFESVWPYIFPSDKSAHEFEQTYIIPIEDADNGYDRNPLSAAIASFNPTWDADPSAIDEQFDKAVSFAMKIIDNALISAISKERAEVLVTEAVNNMMPGGICVLKQYLPTSMFINTGATLIISKSNREGYQILTVKAEPNSMEDVISLPERWLVHPPKGCMFVHQARFIATFDTEEHAIAAAKEVVS